MRTYAQRITDLASKYEPSERHFTTVAESKLVKQELELSEMGRFELQNMRDMVVLYFEDRMAVSERARRQMMSITAVIDEVLWERGWPV